MKARIALLLVVSVLGVMLFTACTATTPAPTPQASAPQAPNPQPAATVGAPAATPSTAPESPAVAGSQDMGAIQRDLTLDPSITTDADSWLVSQSLYEGLVKLDANKQIQPALATSWLISEDGLDYIFTLRPDVKFQDGTLVDADLVVANFTRWFDPQDPLHGGYNYEAWRTQFLGFKGEKDANKQPLSIFDGAQKVDNLTVLLHLSRQDPEMLNKLAQPAFAILNPKIVKQLGAQYGKKAGTVSGTGPYVIKTWSDTELILEANPNYYETVQPAILQFKWR